MKTTLIIILLALSLGLSAQINRITESIEHAKLYTLPNGIKLNIAQNVTDSAHYVMLCFDINPHQKKHKKGIEYILSDIFETGSSATKYERLENTKLVNKLTLRASPKSLYISQSKNNIDTSLQLLSEIFFTPNLDSDNFNRVKQSALEYLFPPMLSPNVYITDIAAMSLFGTEHPQGEMPEKNKLAKLTVTDLKNYYTEYYLNSHFTIAVISPDNPDSIFNKLTQKFAAYSYKPRETDKINLNPTITHNKIYFHEIPDTIIGNATYLGLIYPIKTISEAEIAAASMLQKLLSAHKSGRLYKRLIAEENVAEYVFSQVKNDVFVFSAIFKPVDLDKVLRFYGEEIIKLQNEKASNSEITVTFNLLKSDFIDDLKNPQFLLNMLCNTANNIIKPDFLSNYLANLQKVDAGDVQKAAQNILRPSPYVCAVLGKENQVKNEFYAVAESTETVIMREQKEAEIIPLGFSSKNIIIKYLETVNPVKPDKGQYLLLQGTYNFGDKNSTVKQEIFRKKQNYLSSLTFVNDSAKQIPMRKEARSGNLIWYVEGKDTSEVLSADYHSIISKSYGFPELEYDYKNITVDFTELITENGSEIYKVRIKYPYKIVVYDYFDKQTSLKIRSDYYTCDENNTETYQQTITMSDYKKVPRTKNSYIPYKKSIKASNYHAEYELLRIDYNYNIPKDIFMTPKQ